MPKNAQARSVPIAIVGAGPVGLALGLGLARHGVRSIIVERKASTSTTSKAAGVHVRTREVLRQWQIEDRFLAAGTLVRRLTAHDAQTDGHALFSMDFSELDAEADRPGMLFLEQAHTERLLCEAARASGLCEIRFGAEAIGLVQNPQGVKLTVREAGQEHAFDCAFLVGCDGASSFVRDALGLPFEGATYHLEPLLTDVQVGDRRDELSWPRIWNGRGELAFGFRLPHGLWRTVALGHSRPQRGEDVSEEEVTGVVEKVLGSGPAKVAWASRFRIHVRSSPRFRIGRVLLAGDAAHVHSPAWGFGMNAGIHDAHNLCWKLAIVLGGGDAGRLLDSYEVERREVVVETVSRYTDLLTRIFLQSPAALRRAAFFLVRQALRNARIRRSALRRSTMLDLDYVASPLLVLGDRAAGRRLPNPILRTPEGEPIRLYSLLREDAVLIEVAERCRPLPPDRFPARVIRIGPGQHREPAGLLRSLLGGNDGFILVRPDAHIAWARDTAEGLQEAARFALGI